MSRQRALHSRTVRIGYGPIDHDSPRTFPPNTVRNQKYNIFSFVPVVSFTVFCRLIQKNQQNFPGLIPRVQIFPESLLPHNGVFPTCANFQNRRTRHVLVPAWLHPYYNSDSRSYRRFRQIFTRPRTEFGKVREADKGRNTSGDQKC